MSVLIAEGVCKSFGDQVVLENCSLVIQPGEKVGLLGPNGSGKSTFARIIAGREQADSGTISVPRSVRVRYFSQEPEFAPDAIARDLVCEGLGEWQDAMRRYEEVSNRLGDSPSEALLAEQAQLSARIEQLGGWERQHEAERAMQHLGVSEPDKPIGLMSGGEVRRVALAQLLVARPELAILDEPTNHLDVPTIEWLEEELSAFSGAILLITHDRYLLDRVAERLVEIDRQEMYSYRGGWDAFLEAKAERLQHESRTEANRQNFLRTEIAWLKRSPQARTTKQKARIKRAHAAIDAVPKLLARDIDAIAVQEARAGRTILEIADLRLEIGGKTVVQNLDLVMAKGDRLGVIGKNGTGKTSLLRAIVGELAPASGTVRLGETMKVGYFDQTRSNLNPDLSVYENVVGNRGDIQLGKETLTGHAYLGRFNFDRKRTRDTVSVLSGGERARVALAKLLVDPVNLLLMDEPTNDLDLATLSAVEDMLIRTEATAIVVTHDRYFLDRIATSVLSFEGDGQVGRYASAEQALRTKHATLKGVSEPVPSKPPAIAAKQRTGLTYGERMELDAIWDVVAAAEATVQALEQAFADPNLYARDAQAAAKLATDLDSARAHLAAVTARWEYLEEKNQGSSGDVQ